MKISTVTLPKYSKADNSTIDCVVTFNDGRTFPYTSASYDNSPYGEQLWSDLNNGKYGTITPYS